MPDVHLAREVCVPVVIPEHVTLALIDWLRGTRLVDAGIPVLNQTMLLRGVSDSAEAQVAPYECLVDLRVLPYFLHQLDRGAGEAHFEVPEFIDHDIMRACHRLPGYAVPRYVREIPGAEHKVQLRKASRSA